MSKGKLQIPWDRWREPVGRFLDRVGQLCLPLGVGVAAGYWAADLGMAWMPDTLELLCVVATAGLLLILVGQLIKGKVVRQREQGVPTLRKRTVVLLSLAVLAAGLRLLVFWAEQPSPLTALPPAAAQEAFELDLDQYRALDQQMEELVLRLEALPSLAADTERTPLSGADERLLRDLWRSFYDCAFAQDQVRVFYEDWYRFDASRAQRHLMLRSYLLTFAAELSVYEKGMRLSRLVAANDQAETFLDAPHDGLPEQSLSHFRQELLGARDLARVLAGEQYLDWLDTAFDARTVLGERGLGPLWRDVRRHLAIIHGISEAQRAVQTVQADLQILTRSIRRTWYPTQQRVAEWMGDTRLRRPGRYLITPAQVDAIRPTLEPGDILLARKNWYLSNVGLPGFWPHAIIYLGEPARLAEYFSDLSAADLQTVGTTPTQTFTDLLEQSYESAWAEYSPGASTGEYEVIEAVGEGVIFNTLDKVAGDYLVALRPRLSKLAKAQAIYAAFSHHGKPYDFDFDFATDHALVCTELVWRSFRPDEHKQGLELPLVEIAGRLTLPANQIARIYAEEYGSPRQQLEFVCFLDAREHEQRALVADEQSFRSSCERFKWDLLQQ